MLAVRLDEQTEAKLSKLAEETGRSKSYYVKQALPLTCWIARTISWPLLLWNGKSSTSLADIRKELGLER